MSDKKAKKKAQIKKNRFQQEIFNFIRLKRQEEDRVQDMEDDRRERKRDRDEEKSDDKVWSTKVNTVRNRLTDKKRDSKERWNRFAGTGGEGGRGL